MPRLPYEVVAVEADRLIIRMVVAPSVEEVYYYWDLYVSYIEACGWTDQEFDKETIKRIDAAWILRRTNWN